MIWRLLCFACDALVVIEHRSGPLREPSLCPLCGSIDIGFREITVAEFVALAR